MQIVVYLGAHYLEGITTLIKDKVIKPDAHILSAAVKPQNFPICIR